MSAHLCSHCNKPHVVQDAHKESIDQRKVKMLRAAANKVIETGVNDFMKKELDLIQFGQSAYGNFGALRYHALIAKVRDPRTKKIVKGHWLVTRFGWQFLRGELRLPKWVMVQENHLTGEKSDSKVGMIDILKGADYLTTTFEYFDEESGEMIGRKPVAEPEPAENTRLFDLPVEPVKRQFI